MSGKCSKTPGNHCSYIKKPDVVICTGVLAMIPMCLIAKMAGKKLVYIESFACYDTEKLGDAYESIRDVKLQPYKSNQQTIISSIEKYLKSL